jgi:hypothetical protein
VRGQELILIDRDARIADQIEFLAAELAERVDQSGAMPQTASED